VEIVCYTKDLNSGCGGSKLYLEAIRDTLQLTHEFRRGCPGLQLRVVDYYKANIALDNFLKCSEQERNNVIKKSSILEETIIKVMDALKPTHGQFEGGFNNFGKCFDEKLFDVLDILIEFHQGFEIIKKYSKKLPLEGINGNIRYFIGNRFNSRVQKLLNRVTI